MVTVMHRNTKKNDGLNLGKKGKTLLWLYNKL